jgi:hypothetical protein
MLLLVNGSGDTEIILTLTEKVTLTDPYYLFVFTHIETNEAVKFILSVADDNSEFQYRFNSFTIDVSDLFDTVGFWEYKVYEQTSDTNEDESLTTTLLEQGKMKLLPATSFAFTEYETTTTFKAYAG